MADDTPFPDKRPYLLRAMHQWINDCGHTPHIVVNATCPGVQVPLAHVKDGRIVLNISYSATQHLTIGNDTLEFNTRFGGRVYHIKAPIDAVLGIYVRETGEEMVFARPPQSAEQPSPERPQGPTATSSVPTRLHAVTQSASAQDPGSGPDSEPGSGTGPKPVPQATPALRAVDTTPPQADAVPPTTDAPDPEAPPPRPTSPGGPARGRPSLKIVK